MKIYIAGKITGLDEQTAFDLFDAAERDIEAIGHEPLNPMKLVDQDPMRSYEDMLLSALEILIVDSTAIYMLANWRDSIGARIEHAIAENLNRPIYYQPTPLPEEKQ